MGRNTMTNTRPSVPLMVHSLGKLACAVGSLDNAVFGHFEYGGDLTPSLPVRPGRTDLVVTRLDELKSASVEPLDGLSRRCQFLHRVNHVTSLHNPVDTCKQVV